MRAVKISVCSILAANCIVAVLCIRNVDTDSMKAVFLNKLGLRSPPNVTSSRPVPDYMSYIYFNLRQASEIEFDVAAYELKHIRTEGKV